MTILDSLRPVPGQRVLMTAGAGGIGAVIARGFHQTGARVHVYDVDRTALERLMQAVPRITGRSVDASVATDVDHVFADVKGTLGGLDVLVNAASPVRPGASRRSTRATGSGRSPSTSAATIPSRARCRCSGGRPRTRA